MTETVRLQAEVSTTPYPHFLASPVFDRASADALLDWLEHGVEWHLHSGGFFEQYECNLLASPPPAECAHLFSSETVAALREHMEKLFDTSLDERVTITAHKLVPGQGIGIHTDEPRDGLETHRLVVQLNHGFADENGGHLLVLGSESPADIAAAVRPLHNTGFGFAMSDRSYHAVSDVRQGERYTIVYSFWEVCPEEQPLPAGRQVDATAGPLDRDQLSRYVEFLVAAGTDDIRHSDDNLLSHLMNTYVLLRKWNCPEHLCTAGLFHSIYGTAAFRTATVEVESRQRIIDLIGPAAEELVYLYGMADRSSLYAASVGCAPFRLRDFRDDSELTANAERFAELMTLDLANSLEQLPRLAQDRETLVEERNTYLHASRFFPVAALDDLLVAYATATAGD